MASVAVSSGRLNFELPSSLEAHEPPEARGLARDQVRLMVSQREDERLLHARFADLPELLPPGAVLVLNTSGTLPAALPALRADGTPLNLHLSTRYPGALDELWTVELRRGSARVHDGRLGDVLFLPDGGTALILDAYPEPLDVCLPQTSRLWLARLRLPAPLMAYLEWHGRPIRYAHIHGEWPLAAYQTVYGETPGSAEMPSAGRPFTTELLSRLEDRGVRIARLLLHTGVSSQEADETPFSEYFEVPDETLEMVREAHRGGRPVIAVGTTVVRALESAGEGHSRGWTTLVITPSRGVRLVDGLITGWHEPQASHLLMLEAIAGRSLLEASYTEAIRAGYLWHEFGDSQLIL